MPRRFVILTHDHPFLHWDLMLEDQADLRTWRLLAEPDSTVKPIAAELLPRHRKAYLDYEGPVSGDRGRVTLWDSGEYELIAEASGKLRVRLEGTRLRGDFLLRESRENPSAWLMQKDNP